MTNNKHSFFNSTHIAKFLFFFTITLAPLSYNCYAEDPFVPGVGGGDEPAVAAEDEDSLVASIVASGSIGSSASTISVSSTGGNFPIGITTNSISSNFSFSTTTPAAGGGQQAATPGTTGQQGSSAVIATTPNADDTTTAVTGPIPTTAANGGTTANLVGTPQTRVVAAPSGTATTTPSASGISPTGGINQPGATPVTVNPQGTNANLTGIPQTRVVAAPSGTATTTTPSANGINPAGGINQPGAAPTAINPQGTNANLTGTQQTNVVTAPPGTATTTTPPNGTTQPGGIPLPPATNLKPTDTTATNTNLNNPAATGSTKVSLTATTNPTGDITITNNTTHTSTTIPASAARQISLTGGCY